MVRQLTFPWCPLRPVLVDELPGDPPLRAEVHAGAADVALILRAVPCGAPGDAWHRDERVTVLLRLRRDASCTVDDRPHWWSFETIDHHDDVFATAIEWGLSQRGDRALAGESWDQAMARRAQRRAALERITAVAAALAWDRCEDPARATAMTFAPRARTHVYAALLADDRGRIAQVVEACPGLLAVACTSSDWSAIRTRIERGDSLRALVDHALGVRLAARHGARALLRGAGTLDGAVVLDAIGAPGVDVNDLPPDQPRRRVWYQWAATWRRVAARWPQIDQPAFGSFVSRHAAALEAITLAEATDAHTLLSAILDCVTASGGRSPTRRTCPDRMLERVHRWHQRLWVPALDPDLALRIGPPVPPYACGVDATPIDTFGGLVAEGRQMRHCVASYADRGAADALCFYRAMVGEERLTVALAEDCGRWTLMEASGPGNRPASEAARSALAGWLLQLNRGDDSHGAVDRADEEEGARA